MCSFSGALVRISLVGQAVAAKGVCLFLFSFLLLLNLHFFLNVLNTVINEILSPL